MEFRQLRPLALPHRPFKLDARGTFANLALILQLRDDAGEIALVDIDGYVDAVIIGQISRPLIRCALAHDLEIELLLDDLVVLLDNEVRLSRTDDRVLILSCGWERDCVSPSPNDEAYGCSLIHDSSPLPPRSPATPRRRPSRARARAEYSSAAR